MYLYDSIILSHFLRHDSRTRILSLEVLSNFITKNVSQILSIVSTQQDYLEKDSRKLVDSPWIHRAILFFLSQLWQHQPLLLKFIRKRTLASRVCLNSFL